MTTPYRIRTIEDLVNAPRNALTGNYNLRDADLQNADLQNANLRLSNLEGANLENANLQRVDLREANLISSNLEGTNLENANLQRAYLLEANLQGANLANTNLQNAYLRGVNLEGANLENANLERADVAGSRLERANLQRANLQRTDMENAVFDNANLEGANLANSRLQATTFIGTNLQGANFQGSYLRRSRLRGANLQGANLVNARLQLANFEGANLQGANLQGANLLDANLRNADFRNTILTDANFSRANLTGTNFEGANLNPLLLPQPPPQPRAPRQPRVPPPPTPAQVNQAVAFEIHNAFEKLDKPKLISFLKTKIENGVQISNQIARMSKSDILNTIKENMNNFLSFLTPEELNSIPRKPAGYYPSHITSWKNIWDVIYNSRITEIDFSGPIVNSLIGLSLSYALKQSEVFKKNYVLCYLDEVAFAYSTASTFAANFSCSKGMIERFITCLKAGIEAELTTSISEDKKLEYKMLKNIIQGGYDVEAAKRLIAEWQNDNKNIITENGEFRSNKEELVAQQKDNLIHYLCCELGVTQEELMKQTQVRDTIEYMFSDDNILDNTLGGRRKKTRRKGKRKTKKPVKRVGKTKRKQNKKRKTYKR